MFGSQYLSREQKLQRSYLRTTRLFWRGGEHIVFECQAILWSESPLLLTCWGSQLFTQPVQLDVSTVKTTVKTVGATLRLRDGFSHGPLTSSHEGSVEMIEIKVGITFVGPSRFYTSNRSVLMRDSHTTGTAA